MADAMQEGTAYFLVEADIKTLASGKRYVVFHNDYMEEFEPLANIGNGDVIYRHKD